MNQIKISLTLLLVSIMTMGCSAKDSRTTVKEQLSIAKEKSNTAFVVVSDSKTSAEKLTNLITEAITDITNTEIIQMDIEDEKNAELVQEYRLSGAPLPLTLIFAGNGLMLGGMLESQTTKEQIINAIPTPKYSDMILALSQGKPVFTVISNEKFEKNQAAIQLCEEAKKELADNAAVIIVDTEDVHESKFIEMLNIQAALDDAFIVAVNKQGMMTGRFDVLPTQSRLVEAATVVVQSGCAPGGCGPTCN